MSKSNEISVGNVRRPLDSTDQSPDGLVVRPTVPFCVQDIEGNTGMQGWRFLGVYDEVNDEWMGATYPNRPSDPNYHPPQQNLGMCPLPGLLTVSPQSVSLTSGAQTFQLAITSNTTWSLSVAPEGMSFSQTSGSGDQTITVTVTENEDTQEANKSFTVSTNDGNASQEVVVTQQGDDPSVVGLIPSSLSFVVLGGTQEIQVTTSQTWTFSDNMPWAQVSRTGDTLFVSVNQNYAGSRSGSVTIQGDLSSASVPVSQEAIPVHAVVLYGRGTVVGQFDGADTPDEAMGNLIRGNVFATTSQENIAIGTRFFHDNSSFTPINGSDKWYKIDDTTKAVRIDSGGHYIDLVDTSVILSTTPTSLPNVAGEGQTRSLSIQSNTSWEVASKSSWITVNGSDSGTGDGSISLTFAPNPGSSPRSGSIRIETLDGLREAVVLVDQGIAFTISPTEWTAPSANGGSFTLTINTFGAWEAQFQEGQVGAPGTVFPENGSGNSSAQVSVDPNTSQNPVIRYVEVFSQGAIRICYITVPGAP